MTNTLCLDENYSTTRLVTKEKPEIINNPEDKFETVLFLPMSEGRKGEGGLRTKGYFKKSYDDKPLISIITVVYNGDKYLEETIKSVINQTYDNVEYIIIDGGSTDGTVDIIKKYEQAIDYWVSERDRGIYDAMNKGIDTATGEWINFMNAGDRFYEDCVLEKVFAGNDHKAVDIVYGDYEVNYGNFCRIVKTQQLEQFWKGMRFSHQSTFMRVAFHKQQKYTLTYNIAGDFEFFYNAFYGGKVFKNMDIIISSMSVGGLSDGNRFKAISQNHKIVNTRNFVIKHNLYYIYLYVDIAVRQLAKKVLPRMMIDAIRKNKTS